ncbi:MAG: hypothetical protein IPJ23_01425 [Ignavibacteriales bacterium]|nr:hypothetical protein [Ignavibacteriales bacterium]
MKKLYPYPNLKNLRLQNDEVNYVETESKELDENSDILEIDSSNSF